MNLLQQLNELQAQHGWLPEEVLRSFSRESGTPLYRLQEVATFYPHYRLSPPPRVRVSLCRDAACHMAGGAAYRRAIVEGLAAATDVEVCEVSCLGRCEHAPAACVEDVPLEGWGPEDVVAAATGSRPLPADEPTEHPRAWPSDPYGSPDEHYGVLRELLADRKGARRAVPETLQEAGLRGMGGAGFPTGLKWRFVRDAPGAPKYAVVNADESEPGTFKDRVLLEELPHLVVEGLLIGSLVAGASIAFVFLRHEYTRERKALAREIQRVGELGLLDALGLKLSLFVSPGGYILGEETALIEALEGHRGEPRNKPPFPTQHGIHGQPTLMNNVETFSFVPLILREGAEAWKARGVNGAAGLKFLSLCGDVARPGVYCVPLGTPVRQLIEQQGGGMAQGAALRAFSPGGASAPFLPAHLADTPLDFAPLEQAGSMLGSGAVLAVAEGRDLLDLATNLVQFFRNESCGKCVPCRVGSQKAVRLLERLGEDGGRGDELALLRELDETLQLTSICGLGQVVLNPALSVLRHFPEDLPTRNPAGAAGAS